MKLILKIGSVVLGCLFILAFNLLSVGILVGSTISYEDSSQNSLSSNALKLLITPRHLYSDCRDHLERGTGYQRRREGGCIQPIGPPSRDNARPNEREALIHGRA